MYTTAIVAVIIVCLFSLVATIWIGVHQGKKEHHYRGGRSLFILTSIYSVFFVFAGLILAWVFL